MKRIIFAILLLNFVNTFGQSKKEMDSKLEIATLANGCFWCTEAVFEELKGVKEVVSGYTGGHTENPTYKEISRGKTGYAEAIQLKFDPTEISYEELLAVFFYTHDPTTLNRQGYDVGTQYRSAIFYHSEEQLAAAKIIIHQLESSAIYDRPIVTQLNTFDKFYKAEYHHQDYYKNNKNDGYCRAVISPKLAKFYKKFRDQIKS